MEVTTVANFRHSGVILDQAVAALESGGWLAVPTETGYRLLYRKDATRPRALANLGWSPERPASLLVRDGEEAASLARLTESEEQLIRFFWPGPLVLLAVRVPDGSPWRKIALRCSNHPLVLELLRRALFTVFSRALRDRQGSIFVSSHKLAEFLAQTLDSLSCENGFILEANAPCLSLETTMVEIGSTSSRILRRGFISRQELGSVLPPPILLSDEAPVRAAKRDEHYPRINLILLEGEWARLARRLKTLLETYAEPPLVLLSDESADWLKQSGVTEVGLQKLGPRESERYVVNLEQAWRELSLREEQRPLLIEGVVRKGTGAELMERLGGRARLVINTDDPGYSGRGALV